jgi:hypothetical protein
MIIELKTTYSEQFDEMLCILIQIAELIWFYIISFCIYIMHPCSSANENEKLLLEKHIKNIKWI